MEQHYRFNHSNYNEDGVNTKDSKLFLDLIREWEGDFHDRYSPFFSNCLFSNASSMILLKNCLVTEPNEDLGMELINGEIDIETNLKIGEYSKRQAIYALGTMNDIDEPLFLIIDDSMVDGIVILKYVPDDDDDDETISPETPFEIEKLKRK